MLTFCRVYCTELDVKVEDAERFQEAVDFSADELELLGKVRIFFLRSSVCGIFAQNMQHFPLLIFFVLVFTVLTL